MATINATVLGRASAEIQHIISQVKALVVAADALQELGGLEKRLPALRAEAEEILSAAQRKADAIVAAARTEAENLTQEVPRLEAARDALKRDVEAARKELASVNDQLEERRTALATIEERLQDLKARLP